MFILCLAIGTLCFQNPLVFERTLDFVVASIVPISMFLTSIISSLSFFHLAHSLLSPLFYAKHPKAKLETFAQTGLVPPLIWILGPSTPLQIPPRPSLVSNSNM